MSYELTGVLFEKFDPIQRTATFKVREFVIERTEEFSGKVVVNYVKFQCTQDRINILDGVNTGDQVKVYFNIRGSKWEKNGQVSYFNNLDAWKIEPSAGKPDTSIGEDIPGSISTGLKNTAPEDDTDLPF